MVGLGVTAVVAAGYLGWQHFARDPHPAALPAPPVPVITATVQQQNFPIVLTGIGNVTALNSATVRSMVTEPILSIDFNDGQYVKKGQLLARLDPSTYQAQFDQAEAALARDQAHLENGRINLSRYIPLEKRGFAPEQQVATQGAKNAQIEAVIKADQAAIEYAKTELSYTKLAAPFDGVAGIRLLDVGNIIHSSTTRGSPSEPNALVVINQVQPISVMFTLGAANIPDVQEALAKGSVKAIALSTDGKTELDTGTLAAIDNQANITSGTIGLKAIFPNPQRKLWPGMFVNIRVVTQVQDNGLTVPLDAVQQGPQGLFVFVVGADHKVAMQPVSVRETLDGEAAILLLGLIGYELLPVSALPDIDSTTIQVTAQLPGADAQTVAGTVTTLIDNGLSAGETVVVRGQYRLSPGSVVSLANPNDPAAVPNPTPASAGLLP
jgi:multidrug efflux system membrane fusion protein